MTNYIIGAVTNSSQAKQAQGFLTVPQAQLWPQEVLDFFLQKIR
jgi:hypothetical protein